LSVCQPEFLLVLFQITRDVCALILPLRSFRFNAYRQRDDDGRRNASGVTNAFLKDSHQTSYSVRNATIGSVLAARLAGMKQAINATITNSAVTPANVAGSVAATP
jgi:hypothetical protein